MIPCNGGFSVFIVQDLIQAKSFYTRHFGFNLAFENEWYLHLVFPPIQVGFLLPHQSSQPPFLQAPHSGEGVIFSLEVTDVQAAFNYAKSQQLDIVLTLRSEDWGQRHFCIKDPNGIYVDIIEPIEPTSKYQNDYHPVRE